MAGGANPDHSRVRDLRIVLRDIPGLGDRTRLLARLAASRLGLGRGDIRVSFVGFEAEFELSQGEIAPYAQLVADVERGVIPAAAGRDWTVFDCGANVGLFSLFMRDAARVVAVEPNPSTGARLARNLETNGVDATVLQAAITAEDGSVKMDFAGPSVLAEIGETGSEVRSVSIDTLLDETSTERVDLLKLDVEGHEIAALEGAGKALEAGRIRRIVAEFQDQDALATLDAYLVPLGFERVATGPINARFELPAQPGA